MKCPAAQQELLGFLHHYFERQGLRSKIAYRIPFYYGKKWICYLNPQKDGQSLELCFPRAHQFKDPTGLLQARGRKQIKGLLLKASEDIPLDAIQEILDQAQNLDQS